MGYESYDPLNPPTSDFQYGDGKRDNAPSFSWSRPILVTQNGKKNRGQHFLARCPTNGK